MDRRRYIMGRRLLPLVLSIMSTTTVFAQVSPHGPIKFDCQTCHATDSWEMRKDGVFDHKATGFPLTGQHKTLDCASCHEGLKFASQSAKCLSCHTDVHKSELGENCVRCHTTQSWQIPDMRQRHQETRFPLVGRHLTLTCESCHTNASAHQYMGTPTTCIGCHRVDFQATKNPAHSTAGFSTECAKCHRVTAFDWGQSFDHDLTAFPLTGVHRSVACISCHQNERFKGTPTECNACHRAEFTAASNPSHVAAGFSMQCQTCHTPTRWTGVLYDHNTLTRFPLTGAHTSLQCSNCHGDNIFAGRSVECFSCHQNTFASAQSPNHVAGNFNHDCTQCHSTANWTNATFNHNTTRFPLTGAHVATQCQSCHTNGNYQLVYTNCWECHQTDFQQAANPSHVAGNFNHDCTQCHSTTNWTSATFDHSATRFPLTGAHVATQCQTCHTNGNYQLVYSNCYQCHATEFQQTTNPNHVAGNFNHDCTQCHSTTNWTSATFDHSTTRFPLTGAHVATQCQACHTNGNFQLVYSNCYQCHATEFQQTTNPNHVAGNFNHDCTQCHSTTNWTSATFDHSTTRFPLTGAHVATQCQTCHTNGNYQLVYSNCYQCHATEFQQTTNPNHVAGSFNHDCSQCHSTTNWTGATFDHSTTRFPLTGAHVATQCQTCHTNGNYQLVYNNCYQCHATEFQQTTNPNHVAGNFNHDCSQCHSTTNWNTSTFNHSTTRFPLTGAHTSTACQSCHVNGNYQLVYTDCYQCHQADFQQTTNPNHVAGNFSHDCTQCHSTTNWTGATFDHSTTRFPLTGAHTATQCQACHTNGNYQLVYTDCYQCHATVFQQATNPNHVAGNFSHDCTQCHSTTVWQPSTFSHSATRFPLTGVHTTTPCQSCHVNGNYQLVYTDCYQCHQTDFNNATNPNHVSGNFSHDCTGCHTTTGWSPATFNHSTTRFPLTGAHTTVQCQSCHVNGNYQLVYTDCYQCHQTDFNNATNPNHVSGNFSHDCTQCHSTSVWQPSTFNHGTTRFPLTGTHTTTPCQSCHVNGNYQLVYTDCYQCHATEYQQTTNPNHVAGNFSHDCTQCHSTTNWTSATFDHSTTRFPLTGAHVAVQCQSCHVNGNYQLVYTDCYQCHQTDFTNATNPNHVAGNFSHDCTQCHSTTNWTSATFDHSTTRFPLTGAHTSVQCQSCHVNGNYQLVYTDCYQCHATDFNNVTNPNHVTQQFSHACTTCHSTSVWTPNTMNHDAAYFRIYSGHHLGRWTQCSQCHTTIGNLGAWSCTTGCHQTAHNQGQNCYGCHRNA